jgi:large subunit ribosomal protein L22
MESRAKFKYVRISPEKVRPVLNLVRGKKVQNAIDALNYCSRRASTIVSKAIKSAVANANVKGGADIDRLYISKIFVGQGPTLKRWRAKARGMAGKISKKTSHITVELAEK